MLALPSLQLQKVIYEIQRNNYLNNFDSQN